MQCVPDLNPEMSAMLVPTPGGLVSQLYDSIMCSLILPHACAAAAFAAAAASFAVCRTTSSSSNNAPNAYSFEYRYIAL